jgi:peroxiredoxin
VKSQSPFKQRTPFFILHSSFFIFLFISFPVFAQQTLIKGLAKAYRGKIVTLNTYKDFITCTPLELGSERVDDSGRFTLNVKNINSCTYAYLNIDNLKATIYLEPGREYHVAFPAPDSLNYHNPLVSQTVDLTFLFHDTTDINCLMIDFNERFDAFWTNHYQYFVKKEATPYLDSFKTAMQNHYTHLQNNCFNESYQYAIADIAFNIMEGRKTLASKFLANKPVLYDNNDYMQFFYEYYDGYMEKLAAKKEGAAIYTYLDTPDYSKLMEILKSDIALSSNDSLRELVLLKGLYEFYYSGEVNVANIKSLLGNISNNSIFTKNKIIANDMLDQIAQSSGGNTAPDFALKDDKGTINSILDFRGKYLYLWFFRTTGNAALMQMDVVPLLLKKYGKKINFVAISEDKNYSDLLDFLKKNKSFNWTFLFDEGQKTLKDYNVKSLPEYMLIDPKGKIILCPADDPSHGIQNVFDNLLVHKTNNR